MPREAPTFRGARLRALAVVPARLGSTRLPRKMLLRDSGQYLFEHTVRGVRRASRRRGSMCRSNRKT